MDISSRRTPAGQAQPKKVLYPPGKKFRFRNVVDRGEVEGLFAPTGAKILRIVLAFNSRGAPCYMGNPAIARALGLSVKTVMNHLTPLVQRGFLLRNRRGGQRLLTINTETFKRLYKSRGAGSLRETRREEQKQKNARAVPPEAGAAGGITGEPNRPPTSPPRPAAVPSGDGLRPVPKQTPYQEPAAVEPLVSQPDPTVAHRSPRATPEGITRAKRLRTAVTQHTKAAVKARPESWAVHLDRLLKDLGHDETRLDSVLQWYCEHIADRWTPRAYSAEMFREKFIKIEEAQRRSQQQPEPPPQLLRQPKQPQQPVPQAQARLSDEDEEAAQRILARLTSETWPKDAARQLPGLVRAALINVQQFRSRVREARLSSDAADIARVMERWGPDERVVLLWYERVLNKIRDWEEWSGNLKPFIWHPNHKDFIADVAEEGSGGFFWNDKVWAEICAAAAQETPK